MTEGSRKSRGTTKKSGKKRSGTKGAAQKSTTSRRGSSRGKRSRAPRALPDMPAATPEMRERLGRTLDQGEFIVFDIETTGGNPDKNGITEIFAIKYDQGKAGDTFYSLVNPGIPIPPIVRRMTGINNKMLRDEPPIEDVIPQFMDFVGDGIFVSHNTIGDMKFIRHFAEKVTGKNPENFYMCTHLLVEKLVSEAPDKSLTGLAKFFGIDTGELHRAEADTYVTLELFKALQAKLKENSVTMIEEAIRLQGDLESGMRLGWGVPEERTRGIPPGPGVFYLLDHEQKMLFFSSAVHLDREVRKLSQFVQLPRQLLRQALKAYDLKVQRSPNLFSAMLKEADALAENKLRVTPDSWHQRIYQCLCLAKTDSGDIEVTLGSVREGAFRIYGPVKDRKALGQLLDQAGKLYETSFARKGMVISQEVEAAFLAWLDGTVHEKARQLAKERKSFKLLFNPKKKLELANRHRTKELLAKVPMQEDLVDLSNLSGVLVVPGKRGESHVYSIINTVVHDMQIVKSNVETLQKDDAQLQRFVDTVRTQKKASSDISLSEIQALQSNVVLWWVHAAKQDGFFLSLDDQSAAK
jgi:DNA polymerase III epsilon subunit family exonuclease